MRIVHLALNVQGRHSNVPGHWSKETKPREARWQARSPLRIRDGSCEEHILLACTFPLAWLGTTCKHPGDGPPGTGRVRMKGSAQAGEPGTEELPPSPSMALPVILETRVIQ